MDACDATAPGRLTHLVDSLDCLTEEDFRLLANVTPLTMEAWRKRGEGPDYIRAGTRVLYPRTAVAAWLQTRVRSRKAVESKGLL